MKGLLLNSLGQKEEAYKLAKDGLKRDLRSHVCWHVLGLLHRSDRNYVEATKCYKSALRMDPGNPQIMRDLSLLQIHERDLVGFTETRRQLLAAKPGVKQNWLSFVIAEHIRGAPDSAIDVIDKMEEAFFDQDEQMGRVETSEMLLYKASLCVESKKFDKAIGILNHKDIVDSVGKNELLAYIYYHLGEFSTCKKILADLLRVNASHEGYLVTLLACSQIIEPTPSIEEVKQHLRLGDSGFLLSSVWDSYDESQLVSLGNLRSRLGPSELLVELSKLKDEYIGPQAKSDQFDLLILSLLPGDSEEFKDRLCVFVSRKLIKGVPSTFKLIKRFCQSDSTKNSVIKTVLEELLVNKSDESSPVMRTFALMTMAAYNDFHKQYQEALTLVGEAISITPTLVDLYVLKAKILKHSNDLQGSSDVWEYARLLDLADRYLNSKSVKALLRVGEIEKARETILLFAKDSEDPKKTNLGEMQCMWWEFELGKAQAATGDVEGAKTTWKGTLKHYEDMTEDEFDFALYCLRKMTLRAYIEFLKFGQRLKTHKFYKRTLLALEQHP